MGSRLYINSGWVFSTTLTCLLLINKLSSIDQLACSTCFHTALPLVQRRVVQLGNPHLPALPLMTFANLTHQSPISYAGKIQIAFVGGWFSVYIYAGRKKADGFTNIKIPGGAPGRYAIQKPSGEINMLVYLPFGPYTIYRGRPHPSVLEIDERGIDVLFTKGYLKILSLPAEVQFLQSAQIEFIVFR